MNAAKHNGERDRGSSLLLYPAGVLVMIALAAIAADMSHVHMARASLNDVAATIANDVSSMTLDEATLRDTGEYRLRGGDDRDQIAQDRIDNTATSTLDQVECGFSERLEGTTVTLIVTCTGRVHYIFGKAIPGTAGHMDLIAKSEATLLDEP